MARPKEFDREHVLARAMELFWARGYEATSLGDLVDHLGIARQSLYDTFGDKHQLYLEALDLYGKRYGRVPELLAADLPMRRALRLLFENTIDVGQGRGPGQKGSDARGCMMVFATVERCPRDKDVRKRADSHVVALEHALHQRLVRARRDGELGPHHELRALARYLTNGLFGLSVLAKLGRPREELVSIVDVTLSVLG